MQLETNLTQCKHICVVQKQICLHLITFVMQLEQICLNVNTFVLFNNKFVCSNTVGVRTSRTPRQRMKTTLGGVWASSSTHQRLCLMRFCTTPK